MTTPTDADLEATLALAAKQAQQISDAKAQVITDLQSENKDLKQQLQQQQTKSSTRWGFSIGPVSDISRNEATMGTAEVVRDYDGAQGPVALLNNFNAIKKAKPNCKVIGSFKLPGASAAAGIADYLAGKLDNIVDPTLKAFAPNDELEVWHEPDNGGRVTPGDYIALHERLADRCDQLGIPNNLIMILTGWDLGNRLPQYYTPRVKKIGIDPYAGNGTQTAIQLVQPLLDICAKVAPTATVSITEIGQPYGTPADQQAAFVKSLSALEGKVVDVCWFNTTDGKRGNRIDNVAAPAAAYKAIPR